MQRPGETVEDKLAPGPSGVAGTLKFEHKRIKQMSSDDLNISQLISYVIIPFG